MITNNSSNIPAAGTSSNVLTSNGVDWISETAPGGGLLTVSGTLTSLQIKSARIPIELIAAPGVGKFIQVVSAASKLNYGGTSAFSGGGDGTLSLVHGTGFTFTPSIVTHMTVTATTIQSIAGLAMYGAPALYDNVAVNAYSTVSNFTGNAANDNTITYSITYRIVTI